MVRPSASLETPSLGEEVPPPLNLTSGLRIADKYELLRKVGSGAMGEVWAAQHLSLHEEVAIKLVPRDLSHGDGSAAESRFLLEARIASQLSRKTRHVVSVTDHGEEADFAYLVMELLEGESLDARLERTGPLTLESVVPIVHQVARALSVVHGDGIVHRDLKPSNVFVSADEEGRALIKILDFGIAKLRGTAGVVVSSVDASSVGVRNDARHATLRGSVLGTPVYMSPEQARGKTVDHRADVWALTVVTYHLLTGEFPFDGENASELFTKICHGQPTPIRSHRPELPELIGEMFDSAFAKRIEQRFQSATAFANALEQLETLQSRVRGAGPRMMASISLPPSVAALSDVSRVAAKKPSPPSASSILAAGALRRRKLWSRIISGAVVLGVVAGTAATLALYFDGDEPRSTSSAAATTAIASGNGVVVRDDVPPPEPAAAPTQLAPTVLRVSSSAPARSSTPATTASPHAAAPPASAAPVRKGRDRSEVF